MSSRPDEVGAAEQLLANYEQRLQSMGSEEFERFVADLWSREGWTTRHVGEGGGDRGIDVVGTKSGLTDRKLLIQAKRYRDGNKVGPSEVREYAGVRERERDADEMALVTSGRLTSGAMQEAEELNVKVIDGQGLAEKIAAGGHGELVDEYQPQTGFAKLVRRILTALSSLLRPVVLMRPVRQLQLATALWLLAGYILYSGQMPGGVGEWVLGLSLVGALFVTPLAMFRDLFYNHRGSVFGSLFWASVFGILLPGVGLAIYWFFRD